MRRAGRGEQGLGLGFPILGGGASEGIVSSEVEGRVLLSVKG